MAESQNKRDLAYARTKINFDVKDMTNFLHGGEANVEQRRYIIDLIAKDPVFNKDDWYVAFILLCPTIISNAKHGPFFPFLCLPYRSDLFNLLCVGAG